MSYNFIYIQLPQFRFKITIEDPGGVIYRRQKFRVVEKIVVLPILFNVVNNIVQHCYTRLQSTTLTVLLRTLNNVGSTTLFNPVFNNLQQLVIFTRVYSCILNTKILGVSVLK